MAITAVANVAKRAVRERHGRRHRGNSFDLALLLCDWEACAPASPCPGDLNGDGIVGSLDLAILLAAWGPCP